MYPGLTHKNSLLAVGLRAYYLGEAQTLPHKCYGLTLAHLLAIVFYFYELPVHVCGHQPPGLTPVIPTSR